MDRRLIGLAICAAFVGFGVMLLEVVLVGILAS